MTSGVPHPTGYPTYLLMLKAGLPLLGGEPARGAAWLSAVAMAVAAGLLTDLARRSLGGGRRRGAIALVAGLTWAAAPAVWGQATIAEVYALNALFCVALLWLAWRWVDGNERPDRFSKPVRFVLPIAGLMLGAGLGNHLTAALMLPGLAVWIGAGARRDARPAASLRRELPWAALAAALGLAAYAYLPLAARSGPPVNWGDPQTLGRFLWMTTGRLYAGLAFGLPLVELPARLAGFASEAARQFGGVWGALLALLGLWRLDHRDRAWWRATLLVALTFAIYAIGYNTTDSYVYLLPLWAVAALWLAHGLAWLVEKIAGRTTVLAAGVIALAVAFMPAASVVQNWPTHDLSRDDEARRFTEAALREAEPHAVILAASDQRTFALWYAIYGLRQRSDLAPVNVNLLGFDWYRRTVAATHPDLPQPGEAGLTDAWLAALMRERPVYAADELALGAADIIEAPTGVLIRLNALD